MDTNRRVIAAMELVLIFPAVLFLTAVVVRELQPLQFAAQQIVTWYSVRYWTLWVLLIGLPFAALLTGCVTLRGSANARAEDAQVAEQSSGPTHADLPTRTMAAATLAAGLILVVVALHMLAN